MKKNEFLKRETAGTPANILVTDFSWPIINSLLSVFINRPAELYLEASIKLSWDLSYMIRLSVVLW